MQDPAPESAVDYIEAVKADLTEATEAPAEEPITLFDLTRALAAELMRISKATKMSETGVMNVYSFLLNREETMRQRREQQFSGQAAIDAIAAEEAAKHAHEDLPVNEEIKSDD